MDGRSSNRPLATALADMDVRVLMANAFDLPSDVPSEFSAGRGVGVSRRHFERLRFWAPFVICCADTDESDVTAGGAEGSFFGFPICTSFNSNYRFFAECRTEVQAIANVTCL